MKASTLAPTILTPYDVRHVPQVPPSEGIFDCPTVPLCVNEHWLSHVDGLLERFLYTDAWVGTPDEIDRAMGEVRKLLAAFRRDNMSCCCDQPITPIRRRVDPDDGYTLQISYDDGETWVTDPEDPRLVATQLPAPVPAGVSGTKCDAATNGVEHLKDIQTGVAANLGTSLGVIALAAVVIGIIAAFFFTGGLIATVLIPIIISLISAISSLTPTEYDAIFTNEVWDDVLCILYCHIGSDGHFNQGQFNAVLSDLQTKLPGGASPFGAAQNVASFVKVLGLNGLNNICSYGNAADADCSSCGCGCNGMFVLWEGQGATLSYGTNETGDYVQVTAIEDEPYWGGGNFGFGLTTNDPDVCCSLIGSEVVSGAITDGVWVWQECEQPIPIFGSIGFGNTGFPPNPEQSVNTIGRNSTTAFTIRLYFG